LTQTNREVLRLKCRKPARLLQGMLLGSGFLSAILLAVMTVGCGGGTSSSAPPQVFSVSVSGQFPSMAVHSGQKFTATVDGTGTGHSRVLWQVNGVTGGNSDLGIIDSNGFYSAPAALSPETMMITAVSQVDDTKSGSTTVDIRTAGDPAPLPDAMGTVKDVAQLPCDQVLDGNLGAPNGTCYQVTVSCPGVADQMVGVKANFPPGNSVGTVTFIAGGGGIPWYDQQFDSNGCCGTEIITDMAAAGYTAVQTDFGYSPSGYPGNGVPNGWLSGPGGPRKLACRWATLEKWIHDDVTLHPANTPMCHTGNSGGAGAAGYGLAHYGMDSVFTFVEETSGPVFTRVDQGCICSAPPVQDVCGRSALSTCYQSDSKFLDFAYSPTGSQCSAAEITHITTNQVQFANDSILSPDATLAYPNTRIHLVFGTLDLGSADPQAIEWWQVMQAKNGNQAPITCLDGVEHEVPDFTAGRDQIESDLKASCK
jgi:hypothetical protein